MKQNKMMTIREFDALTTHVGLIDRSDRVRLDIKGPDRAKFLHNLTTNEIKRLAVGRGCETFVTSLQGKTIGYMVVLAADDRLIARADPGGAVLALPHFHKYGVFDDVSIDDRSAATFELHLFGPAAAPLLQRAGGRLPEEPEYSHIVTEIAGSPVRVVRESPAGLPGLTVIGEGSAARVVKEILLENARDLGFVEINAETSEILRIEAGTPMFGKEVTEKNLPQEFGRDDRAISFVKGCYLGQETVARIDALGHVNQILKGLLLEPGSRVPGQGSMLEQEGKRVGTVTSAAFSPPRDRVVALALIKTSHTAAGTRLVVKSVDGNEAAEAIVTDLPMTDGHFDVRLPNAATRRAMREIDEGEDLTRHDDFDDFRTAMMGD
jgi:tRNA-modifying protein YgfZ